MGTSRHNTVGRSVRRIMRSGKRKILGNKTYLYLTEFFAGMSVMAVELGASRLLAPYFSSSQIVWTIIIGTIMIAMALGNIYGGRTADKRPDPDRLYGRIILAAIWIALIPVLGKYIIIGISAVMIFSVNHMFLIWAAFAACMVVFVFPLFLLGTVTPSLVKFTIDDLGDSGKTVGTLNAFNTIGSIIGTFVPTFLTIPAVGTSITFLIFAGILLALSVLYFVSGKEPGTGEAKESEEKDVAEGKKADKKNAVKVTAGVIIFIVACFTGKSDSFAFWESNLTYEGESVYNYLQVREDEKRTYLSTNVLFGVQSVYEKDGKLTGMYYDYAMAAPYMAGIMEKESMDMLILGMGTGTYATQCNRFFDGISVEGVEIDEDITKLAREYFHLSEEIPVHTYDGRAFLNAIDRKYDVIMVDAYQDITIPFQMSSVEFFTLVKDHLNPGGVMVVNMNMRGENDDEGITHYLSQTISTVFPNCYQVNVRGTSNREFFASENPEMLDVMASNIAKEDNDELKYMMQVVTEQLIPYKKAVPTSSAGVADANYHVMTDDQAPVELLGMRVIDEMIADEVNYYKKIYKEGGLEGLLEAFEF
ncbi:MAG: fused MFS/spermidine synthase [Lachnospiraceae bacterium]|nr:fused MFS/spermidine synthase [Lachnospiraceae bacterium]